MPYSTVPVTGIPREVIQETVFFVRSRILRLSLGRSCMVSANLISLDLSHTFNLSLQSYLTILSWSEVEKLLLPVTTLTNSKLARFELSMFSFNDVTGFWIPRPDLLTGIVLKVPMMGRRVFSFPKKRRDKEVLRRSFSTPAKANTVSFVTHFGNIYSYCIPCAMAS